MMAAKCRRVKLPCFGRMPRPAEWPALVLAASLVSTGAGSRVCPQAARAAQVACSAAGRLALGSGVVVARSGGLHPADDPATAHPLLDTVPWLRLRSDGTTSTWTSAGDGNTERVTDR